MPAGSARPQGARAQLGCRTCDTTYAVAHDGTFRLRLLAFFDAHDEGHSPWIDLSAAGPLRLPRHRYPPSRERSG